MHGSHGVARVLPMKTLLALFIPLLSLNLYGEDEPIPSFTGLEGWGKKEGVNIVVEDYSNLQKTYDVKAIKNQVELKLRLAGIKIKEASPDCSLYINMMPLIIGDRFLGYHVIIKASRIMRYKYDGKEFIVYGGNTRHYGGGMGINYRPIFEKHLDQFLIDYLKANPKPKEKKSLIEP